MNPNSHLTVYAMSGPMGSGKTTMALKIAKEKSALFGSLDGTIKSFNQPINDLKDYERHMGKAVEVLISNARESLRKGQSVVFDVCRWPDFKDLADEFDAKMEIYYFDIPAEERWRRVQKRNQEQPVGVYHWPMSREEFDAQEFQRKVPQPMLGLKIITITEYS